MKAKDTVLLSDLRSVWEVVFHVDRRLANNVTRQEALLTVINELGNENDCPRSIVTVRHFQYGRDGAESCVFQAKGLIAGRKC